MMKLNSKKIIIGLIATFIIAISGMGVYNYILSNENMPALEEKMIAAAKKYIENHNIQTRLLFSGNLIKHPCFDQIRDTDAYRVVDGLENTEYIMNNTFWVGVYPGMTDEMIDYMAKIIIKAVNRQQ